jgi:DNA-binding CsgD family transcriptional regulator
MLVGRSAERARIDGLLVKARAGASGVLVVAGEPGIGKSALLAYAADQSSEMTVLRARGVPSETELAFSSLYDLLRPVLSQLEALPEPQSASLRGALALGPPVSGDRFTICVATLTLLAAVADERPVLALVDDAHWLDASSLETLLFVARRLDAEGVALLFGVRPAGLETFERAELPILPLAGLTPDAGAELLRSSTDGIAPEVARELIEATGGNPLALLELPARLSTGQLSGSEPLDPARSVEETFGERISALPEPTRRSLLVAAAGESAPLSTIRDALRSLGLDEATLDPAVSDGLIHVDESGVHFRHPLVRTALTTADPSPAAREAHRALAEATGASLDRRAWHLAAAAQEADADVASALADTGRSARSRGGYAAAASAYERSARLSPDPEDRATRLLEAADAARLAGRSEHACDLLEEALGEATDPILRADIQHLRGLIEVWRGAPMRAHAILVSELDAIEERDPARAARMLADAVMPCFIAGDSNMGLETARRAQQLGRRAGGSSEAIANALLSTASILRGEAPDARALLLECAPLLQHGEVLSRSDQLVHYAGALLLWVEEYEWARTLLGHVVDQARAGSAPGVLPYGLATLSSLDFRTGYWAAAAANATEAIQLASETGQSPPMSYALVSLARIEAARGREQECLAHLARGRALAAENEVDSMPLFLGSVHGLLDLSLGRPEAAIAQLEPVAELTENLGLREVGVVQWGPDLIEAYLRAGREDDARELLATFTERSQRTNRNWGLATAARCRGLLPESDPDEHFSLAIDLHARTPTPFERARTELCLGERLRRSRRRADARVPLRAALETFERLGATPWAERARTELAATGQTVDRAAASASGQLTPQELQVALVVAQGATNREAGGALFLSPKTVETHLSRVYRKLSVRSRTELAALLAREGVTAGNPTSRADVAS